MTHPDIEDTYARHVLARALNGCRRNFRVNDRQEMHRYWKGLKSGMALSAFILSLERQYGRIPRK